MPDTPAPVAVATPPAATATATPAKPTADTTVVKTAIARLTGRSPAAPAGSPAQPADEKPVATPAPAAGDKPPGEPPAAAAAPAPAPEAGTKGADRVRKVAPAATPPATPAPTAKEIAAATAEEMRKQAAPPAEKPAAPNLAPEDQQELELAAYAAGKKKDRYAGMDEKLTAYFKKRDDLLMAKATELGGADGPEFREYLESEEYKVFVRSNRPAFHRGDRSELERAKIRDEANADADQRLAGTRRELERKIDEVKLAPVIESRVNAAISELLAVDDEAVKSYQADPAKALTEQKLEAQEVENAAVGLRVAVAEYLQIHNNLKDPDPKNPLHSFLDTFITNQGAILDQKPEAERVRDGKILVSPGRFYELEKAGKAKGYATFDDTDVVTMLTTFSKGLLPENLKAIRSTIKASGYERVAKPASGDAPPAADEGAPPSPRAGASRAPGPSDKPPTGKPRHIALLTGRKS